MFLKNYQIFFTCDLNPKFLFKPQTLNFPSLFGVYHLNNGNEYHGIQYIFKINPTEMATWKTYIIASKYIWQHILQSQRLNLFISLWFHFPLTNIKRKKSLALQSYSKLDHSTFVEFYCFGQERKLLNEFMLVTFLFNAALCWIYLQTYCVIKGI